MRAGDREAHGEPAPSWPVGSYLVIYISEKQPIKIVAVVHGVRDVPSVINRDL